MGDSPNGPEAKFQRQVEQALDRHAGELVEVLRQVIAHRYSPEVTGIAFEVFSDQFETSFPVHVYCMDAADDHLPCRAPVRSGLLAIERVYGAELPETLERASPGSDAWSLATDALVRWFGRRWLDAGGQTFGRRAWIQHHDSFFRYDLARQAWGPAD